MTGARRSPQKVRFEEVSDESLPHGTRQTANPSLSHRSSPPSTSIGTPAKDADGPQHGNRRPAAQPGIAPSTAQHKHMEREIIYNARRSHRKRFCPANSAQRTMDKQCDPRPRGDEDTRQRTKERGTRPREERRERHVASGPGRHGSARDRGKHGSGKEAKKTIRNVILMVALAVLCLRKRR